MAIAGGIRSELVANNILDEQNQKKDSLSVLIMQAGLDALQFSNDAGTREAVLADVQALVKQAGDSHGVRSRS